MAEPLTKRTQEGKLYKRRSSVEAEIDSLSSISDQEFFRRLALSKLEIGQVRSECLVYFLRLAHARQQNDRFNRIFDALLKRCAALSKKSLSSKEIELVLEEFSTFIADELYESETHALDYYECSFNSALRGFRVSKICRKRKKTVLAEPSSGEVVSNAENERTSGRLKELFAQADRAKSPADALIEKEIIRKVVAQIDLLSPELREVMSLRYLLDYPVFSKDSSIETVAKRCGLSEKGVHDRLNRAYAILKETVTE